MHNQTATAMTADALPSLADILRQHPDYLDQRLPPPEAAAFVGSTPSTLATLRSQGGGPAYSCLGSKIVYSRRDLLDWVNARRRSRTPKARAA